MLIEITIVIIILILMGILIYLILKTKKNNNVISMSGGSNFMRNNVPQVITLTNDILNYINLSKYVWLEKTDGVRKIIKIQNNKIYDVGYNDVEKDIGKIDEKNLYIFDTEYYDNKYNIFDVMFVNNEDVTNNNFKIRMSKCKDFVKKHKDIFEVKNYSNNVDIKQLLEFINTTYKNPETNHVIDGVILQNVPLNYYNTKSYKLKRAAMNTIDMFLKKVDNGKYFLYTTGNNFLFSNLHSEISIETQTLMNDMRMMILFNSPFFSNSYYFDYVKEYDGKDGIYFPEQIKEINELLKHDDFDCKIVEMSFTGERFYPLRIRTDKQFPNRYDVGLSNMECIFSPITVTDSYFHKNQASQVFGENVIDVFHKSNRILRKCIIETYINKNNFSCIDLAGGRGGDAVALYNNGCYNIFAVDSDSSALVKYVNKVYSKKYMDTYESVINQWENKKPNKLYINAIHKMLERNNDKIVNEIKSRYEWKNNIDGVDVILMNYAIHYICDDIEKIKALDDFKNSMLQKNGIFIFTYFDGDIILSNKENPMKVGPFSIKISDDRKSALMPLPTIDESGYRSEPLVTNELLKHITGEYKEISVFDEFEQYCNIQDIDLIKDYLKLIKLRIYGSGNGNAK